MRNWLHCRVRVVTSNISCRAVALHRNKPQFEERAYERRHRIYNRHIEIYNITSIFFVMTIILSSQCNVPDYPFELDLLYIRSKLCKRVSHVVWWVFSSNIPCHSESTPIGPSLVPFQGPLSPCSPSFVALSFLEWIPVCSLLAE